MASASGTAQAVVARTLMTLPAMDTNASPAGWINDGGNETWGNNVDAHTDRNADNLPDLPRPQGAPFRVFDYPMDLTTQDPTNYAAAAVVQLFYLCNWYHDRLYALGFTEAAGNFQSNNFARGGLGNDAVQADAQDGSGTDNANFSTPADGSAGRMQMYIFTGPAPRRDGDFDAEIVFHEATHGLSWRLVGGGQALGDTQSDGMGEGWSDFYGLSLLSQAGDDVNGTYAAGGYATYRLGGLTQNYYYGIRRYPYSTDLSKNPLTFKDIDPGQASLHTSVPRSPIIGTTANEVHNEGEVWCMTLWEARANLITKYGWAVGNQLILQLVTDGMKLTVPHPNFLQARDGILQADLVDTGGINRNELWAAFAKRGMGFGATSPVSSTTTGLQESFDLPDDLRVSPVAGLLSSGRVGGPFTPVAQTLTLTNAGSNTLTWSLVNTSAWLSVLPAGGTLTPGGASTTVTASLTAVANTLPKAIYPGTLRFANLSNGVSQNRQFTLLVGQPTDWFTALLDANVTNVSFHSYTFTPDGSDNFYAVCGESAAAFPTDPTGGTALTLSDDSYSPVTLSSGNSVAIYTNRTNVVYVASNGYLTLKAGDSTFTPDYGNHFSFPRVSALYRDLNPTTGGTVTWKQLADRLAVTYQAVPVYGASTQTNSFQIELFFDGRLRLTYLKLNAPSGLIGLSAGAGQPLNFVASNFTNYTCGPQPPVIGLQPASQTLPTGGSVSFSVAAAGTAPLSYFWQRNGGFIAGANNATYTTNNVQLADSGSQFSCMVSNAYGTTNSQLATLTVVVAPPSIINQPVNQTLFVGDSAGFSVSAAGSAPLSYFWRRNGTTIPGANAASYVTNNVQVADSGTQFSCLVSNAYGTVLSSTAAMFVTVTSSPVFLNGSYLYLPVNTNGVFLAASTGGKFNAAGTGGTAGVDFWYPGTPIYNYVVGVGGVNYTNGQFQSLTLNNLSSGGLQRARLDATVISGLHFTRDISFATNSKAIRIVDTFQNTGTATLTNLVMFDSTDPDQDSPTTSATLNDVVSINATNDLVVATGPSTGLSLGFGSDSSLQIPSAIGFNNLDAYAYLTVVDPDGASGDIAINLAQRHGFLNPGQSKSVVWFMVFDVSKAAVTNAFAALAANNVPVITGQPTNQTVAVGGTATFRVAADGVPPFSYQWLANGTNLIGATNNALTLTNIQWAQAGSYSVWVTNDFGSSLSSNATLTVLIPPAITAQPTNQTVPVNGTATFSVTANGSGPLGYFWHRGGVPIPGATGTSYTVTNAQLSDTGSKFSCLVTDGAVSTLSSNAVLKVVQTVANDLCSGAILIPSAPYDATYTNAQSTTKATSTGDPVPGCIPDFGNGVWYQFTPPTGGLVTVDTFGSDFDTGLAVYGGTCGSLTELDCNDDTGGATSQITIPVVGGTTYYTLAGGYNSYVGNLVLHLVYTTPPVIVVQPTNQTVVVGENLAITAGVGGSQPLSSQWLLNGSPITDGGRFSGATTAALSVSNVQTYDAGNYVLVVTNMLGSATSTEAVLTVLVPPAITLQPVGRSVPLGLPASFSTTATGTFPLNYQWQFNGVDIPDATNATYAISTVATNNFGAYHVVVTNVAGAASSADAPLTWGQIAAWGRNDFSQTVVPPNLTNVAAIASGGAGGTPGHSLALLADGTVAAWGDNSYLQTNVPTSATNVVAVAAGGTHSLALRANGTVVGWGNNLNGQTSIPSTLSNVVAIAAGGNHSLAIRSDGKVIAWGYNLYGQTTVPASLVNVVAIGAGANHSLALRSDGTVTAWGFGTSGQTNVPANATDVIGLAGGLQNSLALRANGTVLTWGTNSLVPNAPAGLTNAIALASGDYYQAVLRVGGTVSAWGYGSYAVTNVPAGVSNAVAIAGGGAHALALLGDGRPLLTRQPVGGTTYVGREFAFSATAAGTAPLSYQWQWNGADILGATNSSLTLANLSLTNAGNYQLISSNGLGVVASVPAPLTVLNYGGLTFLSQPAGQTNYQASKVMFGVSVLGNGPLRYQWYYSATNFGYTPVASATNNLLSLDPALAIQSGNYYVIVSNSVTYVGSQTINSRVLFAKPWGYLAGDPPLNLTNVVAIAVGNAGTGSSSGHYLALKADGKISAWGTSFYGETNTAAVTNSIVTAIAAGYEDSLALRSDGTVYAWGYNAYGQTNVPANLSGVAAIACGYYHDLALKADGTVAAWGNNNYGQGTNAAAATNVIAIAAGQYFNLALRANGTLVGWGDNSYGQTTVPAAATNVIAIAAGSQHSLALRANGTVVGWGNSSSGQTTIPAGLSNVVAIAAANTHSAALRSDGTVVTWGNYLISGNGAPANLANVISVASGGDRDVGLFGTRAPAITIPPASWNVFNGTTSVTLVAKAVGVQPLSYQWRFNNTSLGGATNDALTLTNLQFAQAGAYQLVASNAYGIAISKPGKLTVTLPLGEALDTSNRLWTTSGNTGWYGETSLTHDGVDAAHSGDIGNSQETILQTILVANGPAHCTFWWKVSSEDYFDVLEFRVNGVTQAAISGEVDWQPYSLAVDAGTNTVQWRYSKDGSFSSGLDAGWVDQFSFLPDAPVITLQPESQTVSMGTNVQFRVTVTGATPLTYQWWQNEVNAVGLNSSILNLSGVGRAHGGSYSVRVANPGGATYSSNAVLKVLVPQKLAAPVLQPDGTWRLTSGDADGGPLAASDLARFAVLASTNLLDWVPVTNALSLTNGRLWLQDGSATNPSQRFYRIIENP